MVKRKRTDNTMVKRRRTDNTMVKRRRTDNTMVKRSRTDNTMVKRQKDKKTKQQSTKHYTENLKFASFCLSSGQKHHKLCTKLTLPVYNDSDMLRRKDNISHTGYKLSY